MFKLPPVDHAPIGIALFHSCAVARKAVVLVAPPAIIALLVVPAALQFSRPVDMSATSVQEDPFHCSTTACSVYPPTHSVSM